MDVYSFFLEMSEEDTQYGRWLLDAVRPEPDKDKLTWEHYLEVNVRVGRSREHALFLSESILSTVKRTFTFARTPQKGREYPDREQVPVSWEIQCGSRRRADPRFILTAIAFSN